MKLAKRHETALGSAALVLDAMRLPVLVRARGSLIGAGRSTTGRPGSPSGAGRGFALGRKVDGRRSLEAGGESVAGHRLFEVPVPGRTLAVERRPEMHLC